VKSRRPGWALGWIATCQQTALALARKFKLREELGRSNDASLLLQVAQWPDAKGSVMVVGHQPALGEALARLLGLQAGNCAIRKGAVWWLRTRERDGATQTVVWAVQAPDSV
jgi:phosphohistidine phosphatase